MTILYIIGFFLEYVVHIHYLPISSIGKNYNIKNNNLYSNEYYNSKQTYRNKNFKQINIET